MRTTVIKFYARSLRGYYVDQSVKPGGRWQMSNIPVFAIYRSLRYSNELCLANLRLIT